MRIHNGSIKKGGMEATTNSRRSYTMGLTVQHNMVAMNANRELGISNKKLAKSTREC